ncbi:hypothetical protein GGR57DRAFT_51151 [Xylariaceae sp. FL1272]|nr:hypothetical protein GGR57DRAFT_51151 [Xylariaceae sp. FL1272]
MQSAKINLGDERWWGVANAAAAIANFILLIITVGLTVVEASAELTRKRSVGPRHPGTISMVAFLGLFSFIARALTYTALYGNDINGQQSKRDSFTRKTIHVFSSVICSGLLLAEVAFAIMIVTYSTALDVVSFLVTMIAVMFLGVSVAADILRFRAIDRQDALDDYMLASKEDTELSDAPPYSEHEQAIPQKSPMGSKRGLRTRYK